MIRIFKEKQIFTYAIAVVLLIVCSVTELKAQCFASPGNPVAGSANVGILQNRISRVVVFHRFTFSDQYFNGNSKIAYDFPTAISNANYNYVGFSAGHGIHKRITLELEAGYFINKTQNYRNFDFQSRGFGFSNAVFSGKFNVYKNVVKNMEFTLAVGAKVPFSVKPQVVDGITLGIDVQPSTGNFGSIVQGLFVKEFEDISMRIIVLGRYERNFNENKLGYMFGDAYTTSIFLSKHLANRYTELTKDITVILQCRHEYKLKNLLKGSPVVASGSNQVFLAPQINYNYKMVWNFSFIYDLPVYRYYNNIQLGNSYSLSLSITRDFGYHIKM